MTYSPPSGFVYLIKILVTTLALTCSSYIAYGQCGCNFTIPPGTGTFYFNGTGVKGGDVICIQAGNRTAIQFTNVKGAANNPVIIKNCGGQAVLGGSNANNAMLFIGSRYIKITGTGASGVNYGIKISTTQSGTQGIAYVGLSSDVEIDHCEIEKTGYAGIMIKSDPSSNCANTDAVRPNFTLYNVLIHDNYVHDTGGEGIYLGDSFYTGTTVFCGSTQYCHEVRGTRIYNNRWENTGREAIQVGSGVDDIEIYNNTVISYGKNALPTQNGGIQLGVGTAARCYNNFIKGGVPGAGPAIAVQGIGEDYVYNNVIVNPSEEAITVNVRPTPLATDIVPQRFKGGVYVINNTIIGATKGAIVEYVNNAPGNVLYNNLIVASAATWDKLYTFTDWKKGNNVVVPVLANAKFVNPALDDYRLVSGSPAINAGRDVASYGVIRDYDDKSRPAGAVWDAGAFELVGNIKPSVSVGANQNITLPTNSTTISGAANDPDGSIASYSWTKVSGPSAILSNQTTATLGLTNLLEGTYVFRLTVTDNGGETNFAEVTVTVLPAVVNQPPVANAGPDKNITLPLNTTTLNGSATDADGSVTTYLWTKLSGGAATLANAGTATLTLSDLVAGAYTFRLTVTDNSGATATDDVLVTVNAAAVNQTPTANAGPDINLVLPTNSTNLNGSGSDPDGSIASYAWAKVSGPAVTLAATTNPTLSISNLVQGVYIFALTVVDNNGASAVDQTTVTVSAANQAPVANAGADKILKLPTNSTNLSGSGSDSDGSIASYNWTKISGPAASLANANTNTLSLSNLVQGVYTFRLTVTDNAGATGSDEVLVTVQAANLPPTASAGADKSLVLPNNATTLAGSGSDPDGTISTYLWEKLSGPAANLSGTNTATLSLSSLVQGTYQFRLTVTDNEGATSQDIAVVNVLPATVNQAPVVNAGLDKSLTLPTNSTNVTATASDPDGTIASYLWQQTSGPAATLSGTTTNALSISNLVAGFFTFRITVTDNGGAIATDEVNVNVSNANQKPTVDAGADVTIVLPLNNTTLTANANDADGLITGYLWSQIGGPAATLSGITTPTLSITNLTGTSTFRITVTDNNGDVATDDIKVIVQSPANQSPVANAGSNITIVLPTNSVNLTGSGNDPDGSIASVLWTQVGGAAAVLSNANTNTLTATSLSEGSYTFRLTVTDNNGATAFDDVIVTVLPASTNQIPIADAGPNITLTLPVNTTNLLGSGADPDGSIASYSWDKLNGPAATLTNSNSPVLSVSDMVEGVYTFRLTVTDNGGATSSDQCVVTILPASVNQVPQVSAGNDITITLPTNAQNLTAFASDPDGSIATYAWTKQLGPTAILSGQSTGTLSLTALLEGVYIFRVTVTDNVGATAFDEVKITVLPEGSNQPPVANAGVDQTIFLPNNQSNIVGAGSDIDGAISSYSWTKTQGPTVTMSNTTSPTLTINDLISGEYVFRLTVTDDDGDSNFDEVRVTVFPAVVNQPPIARAGANQTVALPLTSATLSGSGFDPDGSIVSYQWTQVSGASTTLNNINSPTLTVDNLAEGSFSYQLTVEDDKGATGSDAVNVIVVAEGNNLPPVADGGFDQVVYLPQNSITLHGAGFDQDGTIASYLWEKKSGPSVTINGQTTVNLELANLVEGIYSFTFRVTDSTGASNSDEVKVTVLPGSVNDNPTVFAGPDVYLRLPSNSASLTAVATDPDGTIASYLWTKKSGPNANLSSTTASTLTITNLEFGSYVFEVTVTDNLGATSSDEVGIFVANPGDNIPPDVTAGASVSIFLPATTATLNGSVIDVDGFISALKWTQIAGPGTADLTGENSTTLQVSNLTLGTYTFRLTATDNEGAIRFAETDVVVNEFNSPPIAYAGNDTTLLLPTNFVTILGQGEDPDGVVVDYIWEQVNGAPAAFSVENVPYLSISDLTEGMYEFRLTVVDNSGQNASDNIVITVQEDPVNPIGAAKLFSPNGDGVNEVWTIENLHLIANCPIVIFNRLGKSVFKAPTYENNWDGVSSGQPVGEGDYYFVIECTNKKYSGALRVIR